MCKKYIITFLGCSIISVLQNFRLQAQEVKDLNEVEIVATKQNQKQSQTGKVITIIDQETLSRSYGKSLSQLLTEQAGLTIAGANSNPATNKSLFLRGAGSAYAIILIDGIPQNDPSGVGGAFDLRLISIDQIERIEILKGAQSTLYGADAVGGVINIITKKGGPLGNTVYGVLSAGSNQSFKETIGLKGSVSAFNYNINYTHDKSDGINEVVIPAGNLSEFDNDGFKADQVNANFGIKLDEKFSINPFIRYSFGRYNFDDGPFSDAANYSILKNLSAGANAKYEFKQGKLNLNYSFQNSSNDAHTFYPSFTQGRIHMVDLFYNQKLNKKLDLLVGIDQRKMELVSTSVNPKTEIFATYASLFLHDLGRFNMEIGGRYNNHNQYGDNFTYVITPSINVVKSVKLFATVSTAFKIPTLSMLFGPFGANVNLKPEQSKNYEAGVNLSFIQNQLTVRLAGFNRDLTDAIIYAYPQGYLNQATQKTKGFELETSYKFDQFNVSGFYDFVEGNEYNFLDNAVANYLFRRPKHTFSLNAGYQATELYWSANYRFVGKRSDGNFNTNLVETLPSYHLFNVYGEYTLAKKNVKIFVDLKNIFNQSYNEFIGYNALGFNFNVGVSFNIR